MIVRLNKIPAYTLTEVLVVLALTAIVAALSFSALGFVKRSLGLIETNYEFANTYRSLELELSIDFAKTGSFTVVENGALIIENPAETIRYQIENELLIKNTDTLYQGVVWAEFFLKGDLTASGEIDALKLVFSENGDSSLFVSKPSTTQTKLEAFGN